MLTIAGIPVLADEMSILTELKNQLALNGIQRFATFKTGTTNIMFNCPIHNEGQERKPSCGMSVGSNSKTPAGTVHCFTCNYTATLDEMISHCFGYDDQGHFGRSWLLKNFHSISITDRKDLDLDLTRSDPAPQITYVPEDELDRYRYYHPYMYKRKLTNEIIERFDVGYDPHFILRRGGIQKPIRSVTFPVRDETGGTLFIARRSVDTKLFHYPEGVVKPVYGLYELPPGTDEIIVCESIFNALTCWVYGKVGVAMLGLGTPHQYEQLRRLPCRKFITAFDPDPAGQAATERFKAALSKYKLVTTYQIPAGKDVNDLSKDEFDGLLEVF